MTVWEGISLCFVLLLALYGCAQATMRLVQKMLRPKTPRITILLTVSEQEDLEHQIRFAQWLSHEWGIPICVESQGLGEEAKHIAATLLKEKYG